MMMRQPDTIYDRVIYSHLPKLPITTHTHTHTPHFNSLWIVDGHVAEFIIIIMVGVCLVLVS